MFEYWNNLPPELRQHICKWLDNESKFIFGSCTMSHFYDVMDCLDSLHSIHVTPYPVVESKNSRPQYIIQVLTPEGIGFSLDIIKRSDTQTCVGYRLHKTHSKGRWLAIIEDAYENVATNFLKKLIKKGESTLKKFEILPMAKSPKQKELLFDSFNIRNLRNLETIQLNSNEVGRDFVKTGFVTMEQIQSATKKILLTHTDVPIRNVFGKHFIELHQKNLTSVDVVEYLEFLKNSTCQTTKSLRINLIGDQTERNYINFEIKKLFKQIFEDTHAIFEKEWGGKTCWIDANNLNSSIMFYLETGRTINISKECNRTIHEPRIWF